MGAKGTSKGEVSRLSATLDEHGTELCNNAWISIVLCLWLDAMQIKVREGARTFRMAVLVAHGVNDEGQRERPGIEVAENEMPRTE